MQRVFLIFFLDLVSIIIVAMLMRGFYIESLFAATIYSVLLALINSFVRPVLIRISLPVTVLTLGVFSLILNGILILLATSIVSGVEVKSLSSAIVLSICLAGINSLFNAIFAIDDADSFYRNVVKKHQKKEIQNRNNNQTSEESSKPGTIFLEIDGLSKEIFARAIRNGYMPTMAKWLRTSHKLVSWETDLASSTPPSQAGILHGSNSEMPAFRWFDRKTQKVFTMFSLKNTRSLESGFDEKEGLLQGGASINNMFSGNASHNVLTASKLLEKGTVRNQGGLYYYFLNPYNFSRSILLSIVDIIAEVKDISYQRRFEVEPRLNTRLWKYPFIRAVTAIIMRDMAINTTIGNILTGSPVAYATFISYDEIAHHAGIERSEALKTLTQLDKQFSRIERALEFAPRKYNIIVLSDHGQSQGATFYQRYGQTLEEFVKEQVGKKAQVYVEKDNGEEGISRVNGLLFQVANEEDDAKNRLVQKIISRNKLVKSRQSGVEDAKEIEKDLVVLASGNLGLIYFTHHKNKLPLEKINMLYPKLIPALSHHEGIGFVGVSSAKGNIIIGRNGTHNLTTSKVTGEDPLVDFGPYASKKLSRSMEFKNAPDILVMSMFNPQTNEVAAFEELVGSHGGLGGEQNHPFLFFPKSLPLDEGKQIFGAEELHRILKNWVDL